jgi:hypothetical protein
MLDLDIGAVLIETSPDLHDATRAVHNHQRRSGLLDVFQLAFKDRCRDLRQLQRIGTAHAATHIAFRHFRQFIAGLLHQLAGLLVGFQCALQMVGVVIGELAEFRTCLKVPNLSEKGCRS